jgi:urate oxidase
MNYHRFQHKIELIKPLFYPSNGVHVPREVEVQTMLWGDFAESWTTGSNTKIIATETQKNTIYKLAQDSGQTLLCPLPC